MNVLDFVTAATESRKYSFPPESLFTYSHPDGEKVLCLGTFNFSSAVEKMIEEDPDILGREVIREFLTLEEFNQLESTKKNLEQFLGKITTRTATVTPLIRWKTVEPGSQGYSVRTNWGVGRSQGFAILEQWYAYEDDPKDGFWRPVDTEELDRHKGKTPAQFVKYEPIPEDLQSK